MKLVGTGKMAVLPSETHQFPPPILSALCSLLLAFCLLLSAQCKSNHPPDIPAAPTGPLFEHPEVSCAFKTSAVDQEGDDVSCQFDWGNGDTSEWSYPDTSGTKVTMSKSWTIAGTYKVRARAKDSHEAVSGWSAPHNTGIGNQPPNAPFAPQGQLIGEVGLPYAYTAWAYDPEDDSVAYQFEWDAGDTTGWTRFGRHETLVSLEHAWSKPGRYSVRVRAKDIYGAASEWSAGLGVEIQGPELRWTYHAGSYIKSSPAIAPDGTIYFGCDDRYLYALYPDGMMKWRYATEGDVQGSPAIDSAGSVYFLSEDEYLYALSSDGFLRWRYAVGNVSAYAQSVPAIGPDGTIYCVAHALYAFTSDINADSNLKWSYGVSSHRRSSPALGPDGTIYWQSSDDTLYALNSDASPKWQYPLVVGSSQCPPAIGSDGAIYCCAGDGALYAVNPNGTLRWRCLLSDSATEIPNAPVLGNDGTVYCTYGRDLIAVGSSGTIKWRYQADSACRTTPAIAADGTIYFASQDQSLYAISRDGTRKWRYGIGSYLYSNPVIGSDGTVYLGTNGQKFYALEGGTPLANTPWPMFQHDPQHTGRAQ